MSLALALATPAGVIVSGDRRSYPPGAAGAAARKQVPAGLSDTASKVMSYRFTPTRAVLVGHCGPLSLGGRAWKDWVRRICGAFSGDTPADLHAAIRAQAIADNISADTANEFLVAAVWDGATSVTRLFGMVLGGKLAIGKARQGALLTGGYASNLPPDAAQGLERDVALEEATALRFGAMHRAAHARPQYGCMVSPQCEVLMLGTATDAPLEAWSIDAAGDPATRRPTPALNEAA